MGAVSTGTKGGTKPSNGDGARIGSGERSGQPDWPARFPVEEAFRRIREAIAPFPPAAVYGLRDDGFGTPFEVLVASLISARTLDETTTKVSRRLFAVARTPQDVAGMDVGRLEELLRGATFAGSKARDLKELSRRLVQERGGDVPETREGLEELRGVGPKIASLVMGVAFAVPAICVDVHVHRIVNRWGLVSTSDPVETAEELERLVPRGRWIEVNELLVPFGKAICTARGPRCSTCPVGEWCARVGVETSR